MQLDDAIFTGLSTGALSASAFVTGSSSADGNSRIIYDNTTGDLFYDADGTGGANQIKFAHLNGNPGVSFSDFLIV